MASCRQARCRYFDRSWSRCTMPKKATPNYYEPWGRSLWQWRKQMFDVQSRSISSPGIKDYAKHYSDVIMSAMASHITGVSIVYLTVCSGADQRKHRSSASLVFVSRIHRWLVNSLHKGPVTRQMFPFGEVIKGCRVGSWTPELDGNTRSSRESTCPASY